MSQEHAQPAQKNHNPLTDGQAELDRARPGSAHRSSEAGEAPPKIGVRKQKAFWTEGAGKSFVRECRGFKE